MGKEDTGMMLIKGKVAEAVCYAKVIEEEAIEQIFAERGIGRG